MTRRKKRWLCILLSMLCLGLGGCMFKTVDEMYALPGRSEEYNNLQSAIDGVLEGSDYCAPVSGDNQQAVQMADLNGDGTSEVLVFARGGGERPLRIFVFHQITDAYEHLATLEGDGIAFSQVEYVQMDENPGLELVVGRQISGEIPGSVAVYSFDDGTAQQLLSTSYYQFVTADFNGDGKSGLAVLRAGADEGVGVAELYTFEQGLTQRSVEAQMSVPVRNIKRIVVGNMCEGTPAVFVASTFEENALVTDVFTVLGGQFVNVSLSNESGTSIQTVRSYYVYADDIDDDGIIELPSVQGFLPPPEGAVLVDNPYLIQWYNLQTDGTQVEKMTTYHSFTGGWYVRLDPAWQTGIFVTRDMDMVGNQGYVFSCRDESDGSTRELFAIYARSGDQSLEGLIKLAQKDDVVYAAQVLEGGADLGMTEDTLKDCFKFIQVDWKTGET